MTEAKTEIEVTCATCIYGVPMPETLGQGLQCRGAPPSAIVLRNAIASVYPMVSVSNPACRLHRPKVSAIQ